VTRKYSRPILATGSSSAVFLTLALAALVAVPARAFDEQREDVTSFIADMSSRHGFDAAALGILLSRAESRKPILDAMARPAEKALTWQEYRARFITDRRVARGAETYRDHAAALEKAAATGVPTQVILGIVGVETFYGEMTGKHRVIDALATLAFDYPPRSTFFRSELEQFLLMAREEALDPLAPLGSYAGAMGIPQFMPSSFRKFAVDGDADGRRDLWGDWPDVFASVANYLREHGWRAGEPVMTAADVTGADLAGLDTTRASLTETVGSLQKRGIKFETTLPADSPAMLVSLSRAFGAEYRVGFANFYAITRYNRSVLYASAVNDLAEAIVDEQSRVLPPAGTTSFAE
jgi:membrane-bound lytic murein transglycosylase B